MEAEDPIQEEVQNGLPEVQAEIGISELDPTKQVKKRTRAPNIVTSPWFITIDTNKDWGEETPAQAIKLARVCKDLFEKDLYMFLRGPRGITPELHKIVKISPIGQVEVGAKFKRLGFHGLLEIQHRTKLQLDYAALGPYIQQGMGLSYVPHVDCKLVKEGYTRKTDKQKVLDYILKNRVERPMVY